MDGISQPSNAHTSPSFQDQFLSLVRDITQLQWVRESLSANAKYIDGLRQKHKKVAATKAELEKTLKQHRPPEGTSQGIDDAVESLVARLEQSQAELTDLEASMENTERMLQDLSVHKRQLDSLCDALHDLYDKIVPALADEAAFAVEQQLRHAVEEFSMTVPDIEKKVAIFKDAQCSLSEARATIEKAMMRLPGATTFLDRQAMASHSLDHTGLFGTALTFRLAPLDVQEAEALLQVANQHTRQAAEICSDVPLLQQPPSMQDQDAIHVLTAYREYRLQVESVLKTVVNPRLSQMQGQLAFARYRLEQKTIAWVDQQIMMLETVLRENGALRDISLDREMAILRMGSRAAIVAAAAETSDRVTVDDALEVDTSSLEASSNGLLPIYSQEAKGNNPSLVPATPEETRPGASQSHHTLPAYDTSAMDVDERDEISDQEYQGHDQPPAYSQ